ncbi:MAG: hypothetical protein ACUVQF_07640 [Fervidobacterium sp.]|uniref:hypothetical protein n=1 Tax=Fervidobacterium sp. TaxID=1871331 RepID=UPI0040497A80
MSELGKIILIAVLVFLVVLISLSSKREIVWDNSQSEVENIGEVNAQNGQSGYQSEEMALEERGKNDESILGESTPVLKGEELSSSPTADSQQNLYSQTQKDLQVKKESTESELIPIVIFDNTENESKPSESQRQSIDVDEIYNELKLVEKAARKYISGGHKISTLKMENIHSAGYLDESIAGKYEVGFRATEEGYDIVITPKYDVDNVTLEKMAKFENINVIGDSFEYVFWIRAYKN